MRILFFISIVAVLALVWAAFSIARYVRRARRRRVRAAQAALAVQSVPLEPAAIIHAEATGASAQGTSHWQQTETQAPAPPPDAPLLKAASRDWAQLRNSAFMGANSFSSAPLSDHRQRSPRAS